MAAGGREREREGRPVEVRYMGMGIYIVTIGMYTAASVHGLGWRTTVQSANPALTLCNYNEYIRMARHSSDLPSLI